MQAMQEDNLSKTKQYKYQMEMADEKFKKQADDLTEAHEKVLKQEEIRHQQAMGAHRDAIQKLKEREKNL